MTDIPACPYQVGPGLVRLAVRVTPRARRTAFAGVTTGADGRAALAVRLAAPPVEGAANEALIAWLAETVRVPRSHVRIRSGGNARLKIVEIEGDEAAIGGAIAGLVASA